MRKLYIAMLCLCCLIALNGVLAQEPPPTETPTATETPTETATETATASITPTETQILIPSETFTLTPESIVTETATPSETAPPTETATFTASSTATASATATSTAESTDFAELTETPAFESVLEAGTPTNTPTITSTPFFTWCYAFDFITEPYDDDWFILEQVGVWGPEGVYTAGVGYEDRWATRTPIGDAYRGLFIYASLPGGNYTYAKAEVQVEFGFNTSYTSFAEFAAGSLILDRFTSNDPQPQTELLWVGEEYVVPTGRTFTLNIAASYNANYPMDNREPTGTATISKITLGGTGINPFGASNCSLTPTETPTNTPTSTATATPTPTVTPEVCEFTNTDGNIKFYHQPTLYDEAGLFKISGTYRNFVVNSESIRNRPYLYPSGIVPNTLTTSKIKVIAHIGYIPWVSITTIYWIQVEITTSEAGMLTGYLPIKNLNTQAYTCPQSSLSTPTPDPGMPTAGLVEFAIHPPTANLFDSDQPPAVMGECRIHVGTDCGDRTGSTIDVVPRNMELCIDSHPLNDLSECDPPSERRVPIYAPVSGCAYYFDDSNDEPPSIIIRYRPSGNQDCGSFNEPNDLNAVFTHIFPDPNIPDVEITGRLLITSGTRIGWLCRDDDLPTPTPCGVNEEPDNPIVPTHLAVQTQRRVGSVLQQTPLDILGFLARPGRCVYDDWMSNHPNPLRQTNPVRACP